MKLLWFVLDCNIYTNPKVLRFASETKLDVDAAVGKLGRLYAWAVQTANESGNLSFLPANELADLMRWKKSPETLLQALLHCGLLVQESPRTLTIHHWNEYNGNALAKFRADRERKFRGTSTELPPLPYRTVPYLTSPPSPKEKCERSAARFHPPSLLEVEEFVKERNSPVDPQGFLDFYAAKGWRVGDHPMKDWKAACRSAERWERWAPNVKKRESFADIATRLQQEGKA